MKTSLTTGYYYLASIATACFTTVHSACDFSKAGSFLDSPHPTVRSHRGLKEEEHNFWNRRHMQEDEVDIADDNEDVEADSVDLFQNCTIDPNSPVTGLQVDLRMLARQARGSLTVDSNCQFKVDRLELIAPSANDEVETLVELNWYSSRSLEVDDVADRAFLVYGGRYNATEDLVGDLSYTFDLNDNDNETPLDYNLEDVGAFLLTAKTVPADLEENLESGGEEEILVASALIQKLIPGPAADLLAAQPTVLENCWTLSDDVRLRWTISEEHIEYGLEYVALDPANTWMAIGPAFPGLENRLMGGSDVVIGGFKLPLERDENEDFLEEIPFADDYYIGGYEVCTRLTDGGLDGVCRDNTWTNTNSADDAELLYSQVLEGVAFLRIRRPLKGMTPGYDHDITPGTKQNFLWARGPLTPGAEGDEEAQMAEIKFHGYRYGELKEIDINEPLWQCAPLVGIDLEEDPLAEIEDLDPSDDTFAKRFEQSIMLPGDRMEVFWTLLPGTNQIYLGARATARTSSKWMSIAVGESMTDSWAWVATFDGEEPELLSYRMSGLDASTVRLVSEEDEELMMTPGTTIVRKEDGRMIFETLAQWPLPGMDPTSTVAPIIYAVGPSWHSEGDSPKREDEHSIRSAAPTKIDFATGASEVGPEPKNGLLLLHGILMWFAWLIFAPLTSIASRYLRDDACIPSGTKPSWIDIHKNGAMAAIAFSLVGLILAIVSASQNGLGHFLSPHAKIGLALVVMIAIQNFFGVLRPPADNPPVPLSFSLQALTKRRVWAWSHRAFAWSMLVMGIVATITGSQRLESFDTRTRHGVLLTVVWIIMVTLLLVTYEIRKRANAKVEAEDGVADKNKESTDQPETFEGEDDKAMKEEVAKTTTSTVPSSWISTPITVYGLPAAIGAAVLLAFVIITFTDSMEMGTELNKMDAEMASDEDASIMTVEEVEIEAPQGCDAFPPSHLGDGWCDDFEPLNTERCGWDYGDCCNTTLPLYNCKDPLSPNFGASSPRGWGGVLPRNPRYDVTRDESLESFVTTYNNYYEFGTTKSIADEANANAEFLEPDGWFIDISGLVKNPMTLNVEALINNMQLEERMYRHRCVEAWSITSPWIGFPLTKLLDMVQPLPEAGIVQFISWQNTMHSKTQITSRYPWPYTEALTMAEARNELTMLTVGNFQKPLTPSQGAPIRLTVPWKFGYKSIKSIEKINFLEDGGPDSESRKTFWSSTVSTEYGFWSNINPEVPHRRWSQATERHYVSGFPGTRLDTTRMNGYQDLVDYMYEDIEDPVLYF